MSKYSSMKITRAIVTTLLFALPLAARDHAEHRVADTRPGVQLEVGIGDGDIDVPAGVAVELPRPVSRMRESRRRCQNK